MNLINYGKMGHGNQSIPALALTAEGKLQKKNK